MPQWILELCGWLPGIIFPTASALQLHAVIKAKNTQGVSVLSWSLFCLANFCLYIYVEKYWEPQSMAFILTAFIQVGIVVIVWKKQRIR